jgi:hypothetical protein
MESPALLIGKKRLDPEPLAVGIAGLFHAAHVGDQMNGSYSLSPPGDSQDRTIALLCEKGVRDVNALPGWMWSATSL